MVRHFTKVSEEEIEAAFFNPYDLINTKTTVPLKVGEEQWIYTLMLRVLVYIHLYSPLNLFTEVILFFPAPPPLPLTRMEEILAPHPLFQSGGASSK